MAKRMTAKAVLVGLGMAAATLFGAMAPAQGNELSRTDTVESFTAPVVETRTLSAGETVSDRIATVDTRTVTRTVTAETVTALTVDTGRTVDTVLIDSDTSGVATAKGL